MGKPNPRVGAVPKNRALPWYQDDGRGRDHLKGYMSKSTCVGPNGRSCWDPKLAPVVTPGPTTTTDAVFRKANTSTRKTPGLQFGRQTELRAKPAVARRRPKAQTALIEEDPGPTYELFGEEYALGAPDRTPVSESFDTKTFGWSFPEQQVIAKFSRKPGDFSPSKKPLEALQRLQDRRDRDFAGMGNFRFLTARRRTMMMRPPLGCLKPPNVSVVSPGPVYDLRVDLKTAKPVRPVAFYRERKFESARYEDSGGTFQPPSFTPGPGRHDPEPNRMKPCYALFDAYQGHV